MAHRNASGPTIEDVVVYDIEIQRCIPDRGKPRDPALQYCEGWNDHAGMGISVIAAYDFHARAFRVFLEDNLADFAQLISGRIAAGFNIRGFDNKLLAANGVEVGEHFDALCAIRAAAGEPENYTPGRSRAGRKLDDVCRVNFGDTKSGEGSLAPVWWQQGRRGKVIDYCLKDVLLEARLIRRIPTIIDPVTGATLNVQAPWLAASTPAEIAHAGE